MSEKEIERASECVHGVSVRAGGYVGRDVTRCAKSSTTGINKLPGHSPLLALESEEQGLTADIEGGFFLRIASAQCKPSDRQPFAPSDKTIPHRVR